MNMLVCLGIIGFVVYMYSAIKLGLSNFPENLHIKTGWLNEAICLCALIYVAPAVLVIGIISIIYAIITGEASEEV